MKSQSHLYLGPSPQLKENTLRSRRGLAIVFAIQKFDHYLRGRTFTIYSDHQPLKFLFNEFSCSLDGFVDDPTLGVNVGYLPIHHIASTRVTVV